MAHLPQGGAPNLRMQVLPGGVFEEVLGLKGTSLQVRKHGQTASATAAAAA